MRDTAQHHSRRALMIALTMRASEAAGIVALMEEPDGYPQRVGRRLTRAPSTPSRACGREESPMQAQRENLPVIFRMESIGPGDRRPFAIFPTLQGTGRHDATCYAHVGQHGTVVHGYAASCRAAKPDEYADLLAELRGIYETGDDAVNLVIVKRWTKYHDRARGLWT